MARFYGHFAAAYGTFWLLTLLAALISRSHINAGEFGLIGFPLIAAVYAWVRVASTAGRKREIDKLRRRISKLEVRAP